jgi:hypothetical protein
VVTSFLQAARVSFPFLNARDRWDAYCRRVCCVVPWQGRFYALYDGVGAVAGNYEVSDIFAIYL